MSAGDAQLITERLEDFVPNLLTLHFAMMTASLLLLVFVLEHGFHSVHHQPLIERNFHQFHVT